MRAATRRYTAVAVAGVALAVSGPRAFTPAHGHDARTTRTRRILVGVSPVAVAISRTTGRVFVANQKDGAVSVLDVSSGTVLKTVPAGRSPSNIGVDELTGRVFIVNVGSAQGDYGAKGSVTMLNASSGAVLRTVTLGNTSTNVAVDARTARVFVTNQGSNNVSVLDARTGAVVRTTRVGSVPYSIAVDERAGRVLVGDTGDNSVYTLDASSGVVRHRANIGDVPGSTIAVNPLAHRAYVGYGYGGAIRVLDTRTGGVIGRFATDTPQILLADPPAGRLYALGHALGSTGTVAVLDLVSGETVRTVDMLRPKAGAVDPQTGRVVIADLTGTVYLLDGRSGATIHTIQADNEPQAVAIDNRTGRAFIASLGPLGAGGSPVGRGAVTIATVRQ